MRIIKIAQRLSTIYQSNLRQHANTQNFSWKLHNRHLNFIVYKIQSGHQKLSQLFIFYTTLPEKCRASSKESKQYYYYINKQNYVVIIFGTRNISFKTNIIKVVCLSICFSSEESIFSTSSIVIIL